MSRPHRFNANHPNDFNSIYEMTIFEIVGSGGGSDLVIKAARVAIAALLNSSDAIRRRGDDPGRSGKTALQGPLNELVVRWRFTTAQQDLVETERRVPLLGRCPIRIDLAFKTTGCPSLCSCVQCVGEAGAVTTYRKGPSHPPVHHAVGASAERLPALPKGELSRL